MFSKSFTIPSGAPASVSIIDTTGRVAGCGIDSLLQPPMNGFSTLPTFPSLAFLIESQDGRNVLFDLGIPQDWRELPPIVSDELKSSGWVITVPQTTAEILEENKVAADSIESVVWSHWHWDHIGDLHQFPNTTELVVGQGFKDAFLPGYPANPNASHPESYFQGRQVREMNFEGEGHFEIDGLQAFDFFDDGSFYLLNTPGHAIGHMSGLVRTTVNPDTFMVLGGDLCHHPGEMRPSLQLSLPESNDTESLAKLQYARGRSPSQPFFDPKSAFDFEGSAHSIQQIQKADALEDFFFIAAHDRTVEEGVDVFPAKANEWKAKGWKQKTLWHFLDDFQASV